jgi:hypothetical protein
MHIIAQDPPINLFDAVMAYREKQMQTVDFTTPITTLDQAKAWIAALYAADMMFHFEDSPDSIVKGATGEALFTADEAGAVSERVAELYALDWALAGHECPIGYALEVMEPEQYAPTLDHLTEEYQAHLTVHKLPQVSAEELIFENLTDDQRRWVSTFIRRWEAVENMRAA